MIGKHQDLRPIEEKAVRLVAENRVRVRWIDSRGVAAAGQVDGDHGTYSVSYSPVGRICTCEAGQTFRDCSHGIALELMVASGRTLPLRLI
jgi:hypothetical protein